MKWGGGTKERLALLGSQQNHPNQFLTHTHHCIENSQEKNSTGLSLWSHSEEEKESIAGGFIFKHSGNPGSTNRLHWLSSNLSLQEVETAFNSTEKGQWVTIHFPNCQPSQRHHRQRSTHVEAGVMSQKVTERWRKITMRFSIGKRWTWLGNGRRVFILGSNASLSS